jgi:hypothetical protein
MASVILAIGVAGTWTIAALAVFGEAIRSRLFPPKPPKLSVREVGLSHVVNHVEGDTKTKARYYLVRVANEHRSSPAHEVQLVITSVEKPNAAGNPVEVFSERLPLSWERQEVLPPRIIVGPDAFASLLFVQEDGLLRFTPIVDIGHFPQPDKGPTTCWVTLEAKSVEWDSDPRRVKVIWDGKWHEGVKEMDTHLIITHAPKE